MNIQLAYFTLPILFLFLAVIVVAIRGNLKTFLSEKIINEKQRKLSSLRETLKHSTDIDHKFILLQRCKEIELEIEVLRGELPSVVLSKASNDKENIKEFKKAS